MSIVSQTRQPAQRPGQGFPFPVAGILLLLGIVLGAAGPLGAEADDGPAQPFSRPAHTLNLLPQLEARLGPEGELALTAGDDEHVALSATIITAAPARWERPRLRKSRPFFALTAEGAAGGLRGFSSGADDDGDGLTDEDPLDGRDNDDDGETDEDFAAMGDLMAAVSLDRGGQVLSREFYHWSHQHLKSALFLDTRAPGAEAGSVRLRFESSGPWLEIEVTGLRHTLGGEPTEAEALAYVSAAMIPDPAGMGTREIWLGVLPLRARDAEDPGFVNLEEPTRLDLALAGESLPVAVCAAESWTQLSGLLLEAERVYLGVADPVSGHSANWIAPPLCSSCRLAEPLLFHWTRPSGDDLVFWAEVRQDQSRMLDPDLLTVAGLPLGPPARIIWTGETGERVELDWRRTTFDRLMSGASEPRDILREIPALSRHDQPGLLEFRFKSPSEEIVDALTAAKIAGDDAPMTGLCADGRLLKASAQPAPSPKPTRREDPGSPANSDPLADRSRLTLSPDLLLGWPNPFRDQIQFRFRIPATLEEAFVWDDETGPPEELDLQASMPWSLGQPQVSVKIYSINGQELVTLHTGQHGPGELTVRWNGADSHGRPLASGTYFCKLQLDDLSLTRRIVYIR